MGWRKIKFDILKPRLLGLTSGSTGGGIKELINSFMISSSVGVYRMEYAKAGVNNKPMVSRVTKAACKVLIKRRLGLLGIRWKTYAGGYFFCKLF